MSGIKAKLFVNRSKNDGCGAIEPQNIYKRNLSTNGSGSLAEADTFLLLYYAILYERIQHKLNKREDFILTFLHFLSCHVK